MSDMPKEIWFAKTGAMRRWSKDSFLHGEKYLRAEPVEALLEQMAKAMEGQLRHSGDEVHKALKAYEEFKVEKT